MQNDEIFLYEKILLVIYYIIQQIWGHVWYK